MFHCASSRAENGQRADGTFIIWKSEYGCNIEYIIELGYMNIYYRHTNMATLAKCFTIDFRINTVMLNVKNFKTTRHLAWKILTKTTTFEKE